MKHPLFKRRTREYELWNYWASNTEVWVFGTPKVYDGFAELATATRGPIRVVADNAGGMDFVLLPPAQNVISEFLMPSVFLNIRGPLDDIDRQLDVLAPAAPSDLLSDMDLQDPSFWPYVPIMDYDQLNGRLPIRRTEGKQGSGSNA